MYRENHFAYGAGDEECVAARSGATAVPLTEVARKADIVILAIPEKNIPALPAVLLGALTGKTVVIDARQLRSQAPRRADRRH